MNNPSINGNLCSGRKAALSALELIMNHLDQGGKSDVAIATHYNSYYKNTEERRICQCIFFAFIRNKLLVETFLSGFLKRKPRDKMYAYLCMSCSQVIDCKFDKSCKRIDSLVEESKKIFSLAESKLVNAALRNFLKFYTNLHDNAKTVKDFSLLYSNPQFLTDRFVSQFGEEKTIEILRQNNEPKSVFFRISPLPEAQKAFELLKDSFEETSIKNFYKVKPFCFKKVESLLIQKFAYAQDASTLYAPNLLKPKAGDNILDLCAAPGGKSCYIIDLINEELLSKADDAKKASLLLSVDMDSDRFQMLKDNLSGRSNESVICKQLAFDFVEGDICTKLESDNLPKQFDCILLDAPCSNTGVLGRRADARYRITIEDINNCANMQRNMLERVYPLIKKGGRFVYSTCSIDAAENADNIEYFLKKFKDIKLMESKTILPSDISDGASFALFTKI